MASLYPVKFQPWVMLIGLELGIVDLLRWGGEQQFNEDMRYLGSLYSA